MVNMRWISAAMVAAAAACPAVAHDNGTPIPGQMVIITRPGFTLDDVRAAHPNLSLTSLRQYTPARISLVAVPIGQEAAYEIQLADDTQRVRAAEQNKTVASPEQGTTQSLFLRVSGSGFEHQAAVAQINAGGMDPGRLVGGTLVAVLDTGVAPHPYLADRIDGGGYDYVRDAVVADESACGPGSGLVGHGTYVAGLIALTDPSARILPIAVLDCTGVGSSFTVACGIFHAIEAGAGVINMSFATTISTNPVERALEDAAAANITCVSSVSNGAVDTGVTRMYPAEADEVIGIGGLTFAGGAWAKAGFSDWGRSLDLAAPAVGVTSLWWDGAQFGYAEGSGTSYAAALVSGVASMLRAKYGPRDVVWTEARFCATGQVLNVGTPFGMGCGNRTNGIAALVDARRAVCPADFNADTFVDFFDYGAYVEAFEAGAAASDVNADGFVDFFDYAGFVQEFEAGC
jgi:hypothetical protein